MANDDHIAQLKNGVDAWNAWRREGIPIGLSRADLGKLIQGGTYFKEADLSNADLSEAHLGDANLSEANLSGTKLRSANLHSANLFRANLSGADLRGAHLSGANLNSANLGGANLREAYLPDAALARTDLSGANLSEAYLVSANLREANLREANLSGANLGGADLREADFRRANISGTNLEAATMVNTDLRGANLTGCRIHGVSAWRLRLDTRTKQQNLVITSGNEPAITVDNIEVAQFVYLMLHNQKIRDVIDTITSKAVLILGRFIDDRKAVLDALREELRNHNYLPILFDFDAPATRDVTETVSLLARMARFIIADLTDPSSIPKELEAIVPSLAVPVQPLLEGSTRPYSMFKDYWKYEWVLPVYRYEGLELLLATIAERVIAPAEGKVKALEERWRIIEAELTKPQ
jgi:uncharacterized protein YjbI with pentapeptide repeats